MQLSDKPKPLSFAARLNSFRFALNGICIVIRTQPNAWVHALATVLVVAAGFLLHFTRADWCWIVFAITAVWVAEAFNTAVEFLVDLVSPDYHPLAGKVKDVAAGAVLIASIGAAIIGLLVIGPHVLSLFQQR